MRRRDGIFTESPEESLEILVNHHFPNVAATIEVHQTIKHATEVEIAEIFSCECSIN